MDTEVNNQEPETRSDDDVAVQAALIEALLLAHGEPLQVERLMQITQFGEEDFGAAVALLKKRRAEDQSSGFELVEVGQTLQLRTKQAFANFIRELKAEPPRRLSPAALETLAVIAYRQPVVRSDIEKIRGVDVTPTLKTLLDRGLVTIVGHAPGVGQPALYSTTEQFLSLFGLKSLADLPSIRDLRELERDPGESEEASKTEPSKAGSSQNGADTPVQAAAPA